MFSAEYSEHTIGLQILRIVMDFEVLNISQKFVHKMLAYKSSILET